VNLTVNNTCGSDNESKSGYISIGDLTIPNFTSNVTSGIVPFAVVFNGTSTGSPTSWAWDVDGDGDVDYITRNITHTYTITGLYSVNIRTNNTYGSNWTNRTDYINAGKPFQEHQDQVKYRLG
jgi:PKD repeat protein